MVSAHVHAHACKHGSIASSSPVIQRTFRHSCAFHDRVLRWRQRAQTHQHCCYADVRHGSCRLSHACRSGRHLAGKVLHAWAVEVKLWSMGLTTGINLHVFTLQMHAYTFRSCMVAHGQDSVRMLRSFTKHSALQKHAVEMQECDRPASVGEKNRNTGRSGRIA